MELQFLGTGPAWGLPELSCGCMICKLMAQRGEKRRRAALCLKGKVSTLLDCGPDIKEQMHEAKIGHDLRAVLISHEHNDHYMGLDDLFPLKRTKPRDQFQPIEIYLTEATYSEVRKRFSYLENFGVIRPVLIQPRRWYDLEDFSFMPFKTYHGESARGSVGFLMQFREGFREKRLVYTSDFMELEEFHKDLKNPDYLIIQSFWLNEPVENRPKHMSFQRAIEFIKLFEPQSEVFLIHMGDGDSVPGDPKNGILKKYQPKDPITPPNKTAPYPIPRCQKEWQETVNTIIKDYGYDWNIYVAQDFQSITLL